VINACCELGDTFDAVHDPAKAPLEASCNVFAHEESASLGCDNVLPNPLLLPLGIILILMLLMI